MQQSHFFYRSAFQHTAAQASSLCKRAVCHDRNMVGIQPRNKVVLNSSVAMILDEHSLK